jgi:oxalate decarboxylase/phosphoglucose isomerase-like protein (cupin superfamily)
MLRKELFVEEPTQDRSAEANQVPQPMKEGVGAADHGPRNLARDRQNPDMLAPPDTDSGEVPNLKFSFSDAHNRLEEGGWARELPIATTLAGVNMRLTPGGVREMHWHPNNDEWMYFIEGKGRITVFASRGTARTFNYQAGDVGYVPLAMGHYIQNTGEQPLRFLEMFKSDRFTEVSLNQLMALTPTEFVQEHLQHVEGELMGALHREKRPIVK